MFGFPIHKTVEKKDEKFPKPAVFFSGDFLKYNIRVRKFFSKVIVNFRVDDDNDCKIVRLQKPVKYARTQNIPSKNPSVDCQEKRFFSKSFFSNTNGSRGARTRLMMACNRFATFPFSYFLHHDIFAEYK